MTNLKIKIGTLQWAPLSPKVLGKLNIPQGLIDKTWHLSYPLDDVQQTLWLRQTAGKVGSEKGEGNPHIQIQEDNDFKRHNSCNNTINLLLQIIEFVVFFQRTNERFTLSMMHIKGTIFNFWWLFFYLNTGLLFGSFGRIPHFLVFSHCT